MDLSGVEAHGTAKAPIVWDQDVILSFDLMVLRVHQNGTAKDPSPQIDILRAVVADFTWAAISLPLPGKLKSPKYPNPTYQIDTTELIPECSGDTCNYADSGY